jgi:hypothetical protein
LLRKLWRGYFANENYGGVILQNENYGGVICYEKIAVQKYQEIEHREKIVQQYEGLMTITKKTMYKKDGGSVTTKKIPVQKYILMVIKNNL